MVLEFLIIIFIFRLVVDRVVGWGFVLCVVEVFFVFIKCLGLRVFYKLFLVFVIIRVFVEGVDVDVEGVDVDVEIVVVVVDVVFFGVILGVVVVKDSEVIGLVEILGVIEIYFFFG